MRRQGASVFIYVIFGILIAVFVINFGPQNKGNKDSGGCTADNNAVASVDGSSISNIAYAIASQNGYNRGKERAKVALESLIRRELLAQEADSRGISVDKDTVGREIKKGHFYIAGHQLAIPGAIEDDGGFNPKAVHNWADNMRVSINSYYQEQRRGLQAHIMQQILLDSVTVSREEALSHFLFENNTITYDVVAFKPEAYDAAMKIGDAEVDRYLAAHDDEVKKRYAADERTYKHTNPAVLLRQIFIAKADAAGKGKLDAARAAITAGKQKFADAAKDLNSQDTDKANAGLLGWRPVENFGFADQPLAAAIKALKPGELTPVMSTDDGVYIVTVEDKREGDLTYDQVKREIARMLARETWSREAARSAALTALADAQGKHLDKLYDKEEAPPQFDIQQLLDNPNMTDEQKQQIIEQLQKQKQRHGELDGRDRRPAGSAAEWQRGSIDLPGKDRPAAWYADGDDSSGGSAAGSGSGATPATAAKAPPPAPVDLMAPVKDQLPAFGTVEKAKVTRFGPVPHSASMPGIGSDKAAATALWDDLQPGSVAKVIYQGEGGAYLLIELVAKQTPNVTDFDKDAVAQTEALREERAKKFLSSWIAVRCDELAKAGKITYQTGLMRETDDNGKPVANAYQPCMLAPQL